MTRTRRDGGLLKVVSTLRAKSLLLQLLQVLCGSIKSPGVHYPRWSLVQTRQKEAHGWQRLEAIRLHRAQAGKRDGMLRGLFTPSRLFSFFQRMISFLSHPCQVTTSRQGTTRQAFIVVVMASGLDYLTYLPCLSCRCTVRSDIDETANTACRTESELTK
ncbi:hypothetical protein GGR54DRAFT_283452 [Hypoxylon sp. NC1633]|nr:hypothetical protein GGR54DRAFT_283452 [Hypoxylon sp. NC1633]